MVKIEYKKFTNIEKLEFELFKEIDISLTEPIDKSLKEKFNDLFGRYYNNTTFQVVLKIIGNQVVCCDGYYYSLFDNILNLNIGEVFFLKDYEIFKVETSILDEKFLDKCSKKLEQTRTLDINDLKIKGDLLKKEDIEKEIKRVINETEKERLDELQEKKEEKERESGKYEEKIKYEKESILNSKNNDEKVNKNEIEIGTKKFVLKKNVNKVLDYDYISSYHHYSQGIREMLIKKEEEFIFYDWGKKIYELKFEVNKKEQIIKSLEEKEYYSKVKLNGVRIRRNKILPILERIDKDTTKEEIKLWSKFTQKQLDLLNTKTIHIENIRVKIDFSYGNKGRFIVKLFGKKEEIQWEILNDVFFWDGGSRTINNSPSVSKFLGFSQKFGFTKQEVYDKLKELSEKNET